MMVSNNPANSNNAIVGGYTPVSSGTVTYQQQSGAPNYVTTTTSNASPFLGATGTTVARGTAYASTSGGDMTTNSYERSRTTVTSNIVSEQFMGEAPKQDGIRYVEVPVVQEVIKHVPKREVIEQIKHVPKVEVEYVEKVVEVPQIQWVDKVVEKVQVQEIVRQVPRKEYVDVAKECIKHVTKPEYVTVEKIVEVPYQVEREKFYTVENKVPVINHRDANVPVVVAQTIRPYVVETNDCVEADVTEYEPQIIPVDVHISKPVAASLIAVGVQKQFHRRVEVPAAQYNTLVKSLNPTILEEQALPLRREGHHVPFLPAGEFINVVTPHHSTPIEGWNAAGHSGHTLYVPHTEAKPAVMPMPAVVQMPRSVSSSTTHHHHHHHHQEPQVLLPSGQQYRSVSGTQVSHTVVKPQKKKACC